MVEDSLESSVSDPDEADRSLLNIARAVWQVRWLVLGLLLFGAVGGVWYDSTQPRFRTTTAVRWMSPNISYLYTGYWDIVGRIRSGQIRAISSAHPQGARVLLRTDKDAWLARLEVLHDSPGQGKTVADDILQALRRLDKETAATPIALSSKNAESVRILQQSLTELESLLTRIPQLSDDSQASFSNDPVTRLNQQFTTEAGPRLPLENLPLFPWYRSLQVRTSSVLARAARDDSGIPTAPIQRLTELQQLCTEQLLQCWWSFDLLVSAGPLPEFRVEAVSELQLSSRQRQVQSLAVGVGLGGLAAVLLALPWRWLRLHWPGIVRPELPRDR